MIWTDRRPRIVVTLGDPAGVGAEVSLKALNDGEVLSMADWTLVGDACGLRAAERITDIHLSSLPVEFLDARVLPADCVVEFGTLRAMYGKSAAEYVRIATEMCLRGEADAMVTAPLAAENRRLVNRLTSSIGSATRRSQETNPNKKTAEAAKPARVPGALQPRTGASMIV